MLSLLVYNVHLVTKTILTKGKRVNFLPAKNFWRVDGQKVMVVLSAPSFVHGMRFWQCVKFVFLAEPPKSYWCFCKDGERGRKKCKVSHYSFKLTVQDLAISHKEVGKMQFSYFHKGIGEGKIMWDKDFYNHCLYMNKKQTNRQTKQNINFQFIDFFIDISCYM